MVCCWGSRVFANGEGVSGVLLGEVSVVFMGRV